MRCKGYSVAHSSCSGRRFREAGSALTIVAAFGPKQSMPYSEQQELIPAPRE